ncbi:MAG TPA: 1,2-phenylacetyl-CoA epoxidase subunit PaaD [Candidatus Limnocylindrales bacterium]|nr:1,2-phenylacetyl-CoA epoxidase subunit PaaD [Candidatus Limnocylindrales bacterium]
MDPRAVLAALEEVADPEIPTVSVVELGMVERIEVRPELIRVELLPTFVGCPAVEVIREAVAARLAAFGRPVSVEMTFSTPWTSDRISPTGRDKLRRSGFAPPPHVAVGIPTLADRSGRSLPMLDDRLARPSAVECPYCGSAETTLENVFGPTQCRSIRHCAACRQPFEAFKPV